MSVIEAFLLLIIGFVIGVPASMVGLGGGFIIVPTLILIFRLPAQNAIAISLVAISGTSFSATIGYLRQKRVDFKLALSSFIFLFSSTKSMFDAKEDWRSGLSQNYHGYSR